MIPNSLEIRSSNFILLLLLVFIEGLSILCQIEATDYCTLHDEVQRTNQHPQCSLPVEKLMREGLKHVGADGNFIDDLPDGFDLETVAKGQAFGRRNLFGIYYGMLLSFIFFIGDPDIKKVMINSGNMNTPEKAVRRYLSNVLQAQLWFNEDVRRNTSKANFFESLNEVRARHVRAAYKAELNDSMLRRTIIPEPASPGQNPENIDLRIWNAFEADLKKSHLNKFRFRRGRPNGQILMNQYGMAVAHFLHFGFPVITPEFVFVPDTHPAEFEAFLHLWALIGKVVGVEDEFNICLQPNLKLARVYLKKFLYENMVPSLFSLDYEAKVLYESFFKGYNNIFGRNENNQMYDLNNFGDIFLLRLLEDILGIRAPHMRAVLTPFERSSHAFFQMYRHLFKNSLFQFAGNTITSGLMSVWSERKFNISAFNPSEIAQKAFV